MMGKFGGKFESAKQDWETPAEFFAPIHAEFKFTLDAAASKDNCKVPHFFSILDNGLTQDWGANAVWLNPPYGDNAAKLSEWVKKSADAAERGATVVMLIPARTNTNWFHDQCLGRGEVRFVRGRPKFGNADHGLPQPLCLVIFRPPMPIQKAAEYEPMMDEDVKHELKMLKAFLEKEAQDHVAFVNSLQARRTAEYKARGDADADYRGLSGIEETKYWPFIQIVGRVIAANS